MGALHAGHLSLVKAAKQFNDEVLLSIFVNPKQFSSGEDFEKYPHTESKDLALCETQGVHCVFIPDTKKFYTYLEPMVTAPKAMSTILEGALRPGHFDGVLTVLAKFFNLISPKDAYFGKKDAQQLLIVQNFSKQFFLKTCIHGVNTQRDNDGLALSSRNIYLTANNRKKALRLYESLEYAKTLVENNILDFSIIKAKMLPFLKDIQMNYISLVDLNLGNLEKVKIGESIIVLSAKIDEVNYIDNIWF